MRNSALKKMPGLQGFDKEDEELFLNEGDWVIINYHNYNLYSQGFKTSQLSLKRVTDSNIISSIFVVESYGRLEFDQYRKKTKLVFYGEKILLQHLLSGKYLSYSHHSSEEEIHLKYGKTGNCLFTIKPIFKCQAGFGRKIRIGEQICLESTERLKMYIELGQKREDEVECLVSMRKHQSSILLLDRLNLSHKDQRKISNLLVYQLINIEAESALDSIRSRSDSRNVGFLKNINIYGSFIIIEPDVPGFSPKEVLIEFNTPIFIRFYTTSLYLGFDKDFQVSLYSEKQDNCTFVLESYDNYELKEDFTIKVKHIQSGLYLSANKEKLELKPFSLVNTYSLKKVEHNVLKITLLVNEIYYSFSQILKDNALRYRTQFEQLTRELIKFIFSSNFNHQNYLKMNENIKLKITAQEQSLLAKVGFIDLLAKAIGDFIDVLGNSVSQGKLFYQEGISNLILVLLGICYKNQPNTEILIRFLPIIYEGIALNLGIIEALYYLFSDSLNLRSFEKADHKIRKNKIRSIELLIDYLNKQKIWEVQVKEKIFKLLEKLIKPKGEEKLLLHQFSLIRALKQNRLLTIWNETKVVEEDVYVNIKDQFIELGGFFQKKAKYSREIDLIRAQFHFLCTLYSNPNTSNLIYFRTIFPQIALLNYLKTKIFAQERKILLRILSEIYLKPLIIPHNRLINIENDKQMHNSERMGDIDLRILQKIRDQIIDTFKQGIVNEIVDEALYLYIKAIRRFYELNLLEEEQWFKLQQLMQNYLLKNYSLVDKYKEVKKLAEQIIKSHEFSQEVMIYKYTKLLINVLKNQSKSTKNLSNSQKAEDALAKILSEPYFSKEQSRFAFLNNLIEYSLEKDSQIFIKSCFLMKILSERSYRLLESLKTVILLDNDWYCNIVLEGKEIHEDLKQLLLQYRKLQNQQESLVGINLSISKKVMELKSLMYKREKMSEDSHISPLIQNILRELNVHETILTFIRDEQRQLRDKVNNPIFLEMFDFLLNFFCKNFTNINICIREFRLIRWLFTYQDVGQSKILYLLVSDTYSLQKLGDELRETAILCLRSTRIPNCYGMMSLINLMIRKGNPDLDTINFMAEQILNDSSLIELFWKIDEKGFLFQSENTQNENYYESFGYYIFFVLKMFVVIIQFCNRQKEIIAYLKQRISLKIILSLLLWKDFLDESTLNYFGSYLMKIEAIKYLQKLYDFQEITQQEIDLYRDMSKQFIMRLSTCRTIDAISYPELSSEKGIYQLQFESQKIKDDYHMNGYDTVHLIVITIFYPFLFLITQKIAHFANTQEKKNEIQNLLLVSFRKIKELLMGLSRQKYRAHQKRYNQAILLIEQVLKYKLHFELEEREEQFTLGLCYDYKENRRYQIKKLHNITDNLMVFSADGGHQSAVNIYQTILILMYSPRVRSALDESTKAIKPVQEITALMKIIDNIGKVFEEQLIDSNQALDLIWLFIWRNPFLIDLICKHGYSNIITYMNKFLITEKDNHFHFVFAKYLQISNYLMSVLMSSKEIIGNHIFNADNQPIEIKGQSFLIESVIQEKLIKAIKAEIKIYSCLSFVSQLEYFESVNTKTNYQMLFEDFHINFALDYTYKQLAIISPNNKESYLELVKDILQLMRVYIKFIEEFKLRYVPKELLTKMIKCFNIVYSAICPANEKIINYMHKESYHYEFETILKLNDSWEICEKEIGLKAQAKMRAAAQQCAGWQRQWLEKSANLCYYSSQLYGEEITNEWGSFPLQGSLNIFDPLKKSLLLVLRVLKCYNFPSGHDLILQLPTGIIIQNIKDIYYKHYYIFGRYTQISVKPQLLKAKYARMKNLAQNFCFQNGVILVSLLMFIDNKSSKGHLQLSYIKYCQYKSSYGGFLSQLVNFFRDFRYLWISSKEKLIVESRLPKIFEYFYSKMARVQVIEDNQLYSIDFLIRPECVVHRSDRSKFISNINFISTQVKLQSILQQCDNLSISFNCYANFVVTFRNFSLIIFMEKYLSVIRAFNLFLLLINNIYLLIRSSQDEFYFYTHFFIRNPFEKILTVNLILTLVFFIVFSIRQVPIIIAQTKNKLEGEENYKDYTKGRINFIIFKKVVTNKEIFYYFSFLTLLFLAILNKLFVAVLLLDILFQIKRMKLILSTLWRSKAQIAYTFIAFLLIHYFYTIFIYLVYRSNQVKNKYCDDFGDCYGFIFNLCYKVIGGFPGYLYQQFYNQSGFQATFHIYDIFEDFYLIVTYQIFYAVILVIIIDQYSSNTLKYAQLREHLSLSCIICGLSRTIFNTSTRGNFRTHISAQHNVWNYVYYYQYLKTKAICERNRMENHIVLKRTIEWLPNGYAKGFEQPSRLKKS